MMIETLRNFKWTDMNKLNGCASINIGRQSLSTFPRFRFEQQLDGS